MPASRSSLKVAAAQHSSVFLNLRESVDKACALIAEASQNGANLIVFPEVFVPGYPDWVWLVKNSDGAALNGYYRELLDNSVAIPDESTEQLCEAARSAGVHVAIGVNERNAESSGSSLFNTLLYISDKGMVLGAHLGPDAVSNKIFHDAVSNRSAGRFNRLPNIAQVVPAARRGDSGSQRPIRR